MRNLSGISVKAWVADRSSLVKNHQTFFNKYLNALCLIYQNMNDDREGIGLKYVNPLSANPTKW